MGGAAWFLVIIFTTTSGVAIDNVQFETEESCVAAMKIIRQSESLLNDLFLRCIRNY